MNPTKISYHTIAARDLRVGDRLSRAAVDALDNWYDDTDSIGEDVTVTAIGTAESEEFGGLVTVTLDDDGMPIDARPDQRITVVRPRGAFAETRAHRRQPPSVGDGIAPDADEQINPGGDVRTEARGMSVADLAIIVNRLLAEHEGHRTLVFQPADITSSGEPEVWAVTSEVADGVPGMLYVATVDITDQPEGYDHGQATQDARTATGLSIPPDQQQALSTAVRARMRTCDGTMRAAAEWAGTAGVAWPQLRHELQENGGYCDCEIALNVFGEEFAS